jgi:phenylalanyl-tRNA synthetase alpha chain
MTNTNQKLTQISTTFTKDLKLSNSLKKIDELNTKYLGKKGTINSIFKNLAKTDKAKFGKEINQLKNQITNSIKEKKTIVQQSETNNYFDVTIPGNSLPQGHLHLLTQAINDIESIFTRAGFVRRRYPEVDTDWYAAEGLNIPKNHPARDDQETFYVSDDVVLTAHTSNGQLREMEMVKTPPIKMINIGKTYRRQLDISHTPMFHQFEGLLIDKNINITHLIGISNYFVQNYFGKNSKIRLRPHHFQFTEPSFEVDIICSHCQGKGCRLCKSGWLELGGAGMVHPQVLKNGGINQKKYSGFAFGWGIERVIAIKYGLGDIRHLYTNDLRILYQF